jgi:hypothetical protein
MCGLNNLKRNSMEETLKEAAKKRYIEGVYVINGIDICDVSRECFIEGAKFQAERMYSEEEVIELLTARCKHFGTTMTPFRELLLKQDLEWFEENKKNSMGKVTIEFDTVEEAQDIRDALDGYKWKLAVWDLDQKLRDTTKYGASLIGTKPGASAEEQDVAEKVRDLIRECLSDYNLEME